MRQTVRGCAVAALVLGMTGGAAADEAPPARLGAVVVTATQVEQPVEDVQASVEVIDDEAISRFAGNSPVEVLKYATGVQADSSGSSSRVRLRGFNDNQTLILVDGQRRTNKYGSANLNHTAVEDIERIEIVRGPLSSLYGSDAMGGVVNVITRAPGTAPGTRVAVTAGTDQTRQRDTLNMAASHELGTPDYGHRLSVERRLRGPYRENERGLETDYNRLRHDFINYRGQAAVGDGGNVDWTVEFLDQDDEGTRLDRFGVPYTNFERERRWFLGGGYGVWVGPGELSLRAGYGDSDAESKRDAATTETTDFRQLQADGVYTFGLGDSHLASVGAGWKRDDLEVSTYTNSKRRDVLFALAQDQWELAPDVSLVAGVRHDHYSDFGHTTNPRATIAWTPGPWQVRGGFGTAFRAPSQTEQYISIVRGPFLIQGNPNLEAEDSRTYEAAVRYTGARGFAELVAHRSDVSNLITSVRTAAVVGGRTVVRYDNVDEALLQGVEFSGRLDLAEGWSLGFGAEYLDARDERADTRLLQRARWTYRLGVDYDADAWSVSVRGRRLQDYYASDPGRPTPPPYNSDHTVVDVHLDWRLNETVTLFAGIDNIFDSREPDNFVITSSNHSDPDRRYFYTGLRARF